MPDSSVVIRLLNVSKTFKIKDRNTNTIRGMVVNLFNYNRKREIKALNNINLEINEGEFFGIIGSNGSGKSTLLKLMTSVYLPDKGGKISISGNFQSLALGTGFDIELTARENIYLNGSLNGLSFKKIGEIFKDIVEFSELEQFIDTKVKYFSSGMVSRLAFSIAVYVDADILFLDEFGGVGDAGFKKKSEQVFKNSIIRGKTIVHVSHELDVLQEYADRILFLNKGEQVLVDKPEVVLAKYDEIINTWYFLQLNCFIKDCKNLIGELTLKPDNLS